MTAGLQKWKEHMVMHDNQEGLIFQRELARLHNDYERCNEIFIKELLNEDIELLEKAVQLLLQKGN